MCGASKALTMISKTVCCRDSFANFVISLLTGNMTDNWFSSIGLSSGGEYFSASWGILQFLSGYLELAVLCKRRYKFQLCYRKHEKLLTY